MSRTDDSLARRYGAPRPVRRTLLIGCVAVVAVAFLGWLAWVTVVHSDPAVDSQIISRDIVDDHHSIAVIRVDLRDDDVVATCTVRALAEDKSIVGQVTFTPDAADGPDHEVEIATERRPTAVESLGCTTPDQPRPR